MSQFPLGPSHCQGSRLLRPGGRLSRLLRPGGRLSRLLRPGGRLSRPLRPGGRLICQSHPTSPPTCQSHPTSPPTCQSHLTSPLTCQSHLTSPLTCQSHLTSPLTCQSHLTSPLTCQSILTPQQFTQCHFTSLLSLPPRPGGLLSHWPHMDLALRSLPRFYLRSTALLDCAVLYKYGTKQSKKFSCTRESSVNSLKTLLGPIAASGFVCVKCLEAALWGGSVTILVASHHTTATHHPWTTTPIIHCTTTHTYPPLH